jgi:hypothetical protein
MSTNSEKYRQLADIKNAAEFLLRILGVEKLDDLPLPIDVNAIVKELKHVTYSCEPSFDKWLLSGEIRVNRVEASEVKNISIWTNPSEIGERQRFSLSHELGHLIHDVIPNIDDPQKGEYIEEVFHRDNTSSPQETRANIFAAQLLMPAILLKREVQKLAEQIKKEKRKITIDTVIEMLAGIFSVSRIAMKIRLKQLGYVK